ncbi:MAG: arginine--tRNA ligase [Chloroflexota bacterium]
MRDGASGTLRGLVQARIAAAFQGANGGSQAPARDVLNATDIEVVRPQLAEHGDFSTNLAMKLAGPLRQPPRKIAEALVQHLNAGPEDELIARAEVAGPGFVNVWLASRHVERSLDDIRANATTYGAAPTEHPKSINVEFVSANPTGPLTVGNARGAFVGDLLCRVLEAVGHKVTREYYFNDSGAQVEKLGLSIRAIRAGDEVPEDGYHGDYVKELASQVPDEVLHLAEATPVRTGWVYGEWASERIREGIEASLERLGVQFDVWKGEGSLHTEGWVERGIDQLKVSGHMYENDGALWFRSTAFGDDKDRVVIRSNGEPTYFASDIGYVVEKFSRGFDELIYIWGADHHGTIARLKNAAEALGFDRDAVNVLLIAWVRFVRDGEEMSMSKRAGEFVRLDELLEEVGVDAARWSFASRAPSTGIDFDIELARKQSAENPVYYVQYAHARIASMLRKAADEGLRAADSLDGALAADDIALALAKELLQLPDIVLDAAAERQTQAITTFATELATKFHSFYRDRHVVDKDDPQTSAVRLALVDAVRITLARSLGLLGISAPESM